MSNVRCRMSDVRGAEDAANQQPSTSAIRHRTSDMGFTLVELLLAMSISAVIGVAIAAALHASFYAYASSTESAMAQTSARLVMQRALASIRKSTLHDAYDPADSGVTLLAPTDSNHPLETVGMHMMLPDGSEMRMWWAVNTAYNDADLGDVWYDDPNWTSQAPVVMIKRVRCQRTAGNEPYIFTLGSRSTDAGLVLSRATLDLTVEPDPETLTGAETAIAVDGAIRLVGSSMPRKSLEN